MRYAILFLLGNVLSLKAQNFPIRWLLPREMQTQQAVYTHRSQFSIKLEIDTPPNQSPEQWKVQLFRNGVAYLPPNKKMGEVRLLKNKDASSLILTEEVLLEEGENRWEAEIKSLQGTTLRSNPLRIVRKTGKPNLYLVCVGVPYNLKYTQNDAAAIFSKFKTQTGHLFNRVEGQILVCDQDTRFSKLGQTLSDLQYQNFTEEDVLILFFSSHGKASNAFGKTDFGLVSNDADMGVNDERYVLLFYQKDIIHNISQLPCKRVIFLDACHSGAAKGDKNWIGTFDDAQKAISQTPPGIVTIASSSKEESSWENPVWKHGAFTYALLEGLSGKADLPDKNGKKDASITVLELADYLKNRVPVLVDSAFHKPQQPYLVQGPIQDYPLFNYQQKGHEMAALLPPCSPEKPMEKSNMSSNISVVSIVPEKSQMDWPMMQKSIEFLQSKLPDFQISQGKEEWVRNGSVISILDGYPPTSDLKADFGANYLCVVTRSPTRFRQEKTYWVAQTQTKFSFVSTQTKTIIDTRELDGEGKAVTQKEAETKAFDNALQKLIKVKINLTVE